MARLHTYNTRRKNKLRKSNAQAKQQKPQKQQSTAGAKRGKK